MKPVVAAKLLLVSPVVVLVVGMVKVLFASLVDVVVEGGGKLLLILWVKVLTLPVAKVQVVFPLNHCIAVGRVARGGGVIQGANHRRNGRSRIRQNGVNIRGNVRRRQFV